MFLADWLGRTGCLHDDKVEEIIVMRVEIWLSMTDSAEWEVLFQFCTFYFGKYLIGLCVWAFESGVIKVCIYKTMRYLTENDRPAIHSTFPF